MPVTIKRYANPAWRDTEILRYMGVKMPTEELTRLVADCKRLCEGMVEPCVCYRELPVRLDGDSIIVDRVRWESHDLALCLTGCRRVVVFVATIGFSIDRLIKKYATLSPTTALALSAIGNERIEEVCNLFSEEMRVTYGSIRPRFSAGYGDLPLGCQTDLFKMLDATRHTGVALTDSLLMTPTKSVSAIIGIPD